MSFEIPISTPPINVLKHLVSLDS